jgi:hypothetical protein
MITSDEAALRRRFFQLLALTTVIKLWLATAIPFTGDEAYFYLWGSYPDWMVAMGLAESVLLDALVAPARHRAVDCSRLRPDGLVATAAATSG